MKHTIILLLTALCCVTACTEIVEVNAPKGASQAIIEGRVTSRASNDNRVVVSIKASKPFFDATPLPSITDASVVLYENGILKGNVPHSDDVPGTYSRRFAGIDTGNIYFLEVSIPRSNPHLPGKIWRSRPDTLKRVFTYDSLVQKNLDLTTVPAAFDEGAHVLGYFREPKGKGDFFQIVTFINDTIQSTEIFTLTDEFVDGKYIGKDFPPLTLYGPFNNPGDKLQVFTYSITKRHYKYLQRVQEQTSTGTLFDPPPAPLYGNFYNKDNPDELAFGFFGASYLALDTITYRP